MIVGIINCDCGDNCDCGGGCDWEMCVIVGIIVTGGIIVIVRVGVTGRCV